jgi:hypothetical protein
MSAVIRTLLVCWLVLALPVQGVLAATRVGCAAHHPGSTVAGSVVHQAGMAAAHHHHAGLHAEAAHDRTASAADADEASNEGKCSVCAACCAPGVIPSAPCGVPADAAAPTRFAAVDATFQVRASDGPERPPRTPLD